VIHELIIDSTFASTHKHFDNYQIIYLRNLSNRHNWSWLQNVRATTEYY